MEDKAGKLSQNVWLLPKVPAKAMLVHLCGFGRENGLRLETDTDLNGPMYLLLSFDAFASKAIMVFSGRLYNKGPSHCRDK